MAKKRSKDADEGEQFKMVGKLTKTKKSSSNINSSSVGVKMMKSERGNEAEKMHVVKNNIEEEKKKCVVYDENNINARVYVMEGFWDEWPLSCWCVREDHEEMFWEYLKVPVWDEEDFRGGFCGYNDIIWEDDIWQLKDIKEVPKSCI
ncbi:hypothetical protein AQUCO_02600297v1 [Aquilegia coerulea]|uniref:Uncharacterized protein n=1 Tax=Aquilegia coerulea TaxID=218851 RepID=A0A2G5D8B6_AQUCA|nr:hypothetical protein AQUCO_02600297v1 [Aquilegia coerulea]